MLNIDATDKIEGIASVADKVEFTCSVVDGTTVKSSEGLLSNSQTQIYLAAAVTRILSLTLVNTHTSAVTVNVQKDPTDAGTLYRIIPKDLSLGIGYMLVFDGQRCTVMDASGNITSSLANPMDAAGELIYGGANGVMAALDAGATTKILVGGGAAAPVWTEATGTGAPVRAGAPTFTGQPIIPTINLTGGQIAFPATAVPSGDANTLDDYEEGTWTTTFVPAAGAFSVITYDAAAAGLYTKMGRVAYIQGSIRTDSLTLDTASGNLYIGGLPFTPLAGYAGIAAGIVMSSAFTWSGEYPSKGRVIEATTTIQLYFRATADAALQKTQANDLTTGAVANANSLTFWGFYVVS